MPTNLEEYKEVKIEERSQRDRAKAWRMEMEAFCSRSLLRGRKEPFLDKGTNLKAD